ncbi:MAG: UDP-N-acetylglucosamine--N-acetylmuramyl-(pentapeptide) pyrophosphoryl-undecaprenol N-acetylglucosamine transferase [Candidatus Endobugula sp.]|jgi:UDP-N-acetylglucosamine--N-acetylmuramyl-(pentapeptide) pyrophosphoryl-undecaprenol N-acetylglucosamine transferase
MVSSVHPCSYLIMAGGTGGHIFPAMAVAKKLIQRGATVSWLGTLHGMESAIVPAENIPLHTITIKGFRGKNWLQKMIVPLLLIRSIFQAIQVIRQTRSTVVIGFGGFVAAPGGIAARLLGKKLIIHEQNSIAGSTNKLLSKLSHQTLEAFPNTLVNGIHVGNPIRSEITDLNNTKQSNDAPKKTLHVLVMGGSLGAKAINDIAPSAFALTSKLTRKDSALLVVDVWHQTGKGKQNRVNEDYKTLNVAAKVDEFIDDVAAAYAWADVIICRAGALTVSEVAIAGVPAIFIPLPSAIDNHQYHNAKWLVNNNAALLVEQKNLTDESLSECLMTLVNDNQKLLHMKIELQHLALPKATDHVVAYCEALCTASAKEIRHAT